MTTLVVNIPNSQISNFAVYINSESIDDAGRLLDVTAWLQEWMDSSLWDMARNNALANVADPTV
jgi:hypothetical protein